MSERNDLTFKPVAGLAKALTVFLWLSVADAVWGTGWSWYDLLVRDRAYGSDGSPAFEDLTAYDWISLVVGLAATVLFIVWLWRARSNAEFFCRAQHRRRRGWVVGGWFCPVVNLWFPKQIVDDVIAASDPRTPPFTPNLRDIRPSRLVLAWWLTWLGSILVTFAAAGVEPYPDDPDYGLALTSAILDTAGTALVAVCAWLAVRIIERIGDDQSTRAPVAWWASDQHVTG